MKIKKIAFCFVWNISLYMLAEHISKDTLHRNLKNNTLLIINFNKPHYENISFLQKTYGPYFAHIIFYGPTPDPRVHHYYPKKTYWMLSYGVLVDAMERYPQYDGYFWLNDDCALFIWNLMGLDLQKIWMSKPGFINISGLEKGTSNLNQFYESPFWQCRSYSSKLIKVYQALPLALKNILINNYGEDTIPWGPAEGCYIPKKHCQNFITCAKLCLKEGIIVEQALHLILACLDTKERQETLNISWTETSINKNCTPHVHSKYELKRHPFFQNLINNNIALFHHMKFSHQKNRALMQYCYQLITEPSREHHRSGSI